MNETLYHVVFYQAMDDKLRVIYAKILKRLTSVQLRDKDGQRLIETRDYELINRCFSKMSAK